MKKKSYWHFCVLGITQSPKSYKQTKKNLFYKMILKYFFRIFDVTFMYIGDQDDGVVGT